MRPIKIGQMTDGLYAVVMDVPAFHAREKAPFPERERSRVAYKGHAARDHSFQGALLYPRMSFSFSFTCARLTWV